MVQYIKNFEKEIDMDIRRMIGQHFASGFEGTSIPDDFRSHVRETKIGNVILFSRNVAAKEQLKRLCEDIQTLVKEATGQPAFIFIDQEGGMVSRLKDDATPVPGAMALAATGDAHNAYEAGKITGVELGAMGVNFDLAPVLDVNSNPRNPVIGGRSYGDEPSSVGQFGVQMFKGLRDGGVLCCGKHFPGHGDTAVDSHLGLPTVDKSMEELSQTELAPFKIAINNGIPGIMSTHILFPQLEEEHIPATMSRRIMTGLLKETLGFKGLVLSDCMMMGAIADHYGTVNGMVRALQAGVDIVFASHDAALCTKAAQRILSLLEDDPALLEEMEASAQKILSFKHHLPVSHDSLESVGNADHRAKMQRVFEQSLTVLGGEEAPIPEPGDSPLFIYTRPVATTQASDILPEGLSFGKTMRQHFGGQEIVMSMDPEDEHIAEMVSKAQKSTAVIIATYNGHLHVGQLRAARALEEAGVPLVWVALRNPYDLARLAPGTIGVAAYAYSQPVLDALVRLLNGEITCPTGRLPVTLPKE